MPRLLAIGDIHGCLTALQALEAEVPFRDDDVIVTLGDYVDRGPDTRGVLDWLIERHRRELLVPLRGNHDMMMAYAPDDRHARDMWLSVGGGETLRSYGSGGEIGTIADVPAAHWRFLRKELRPWYETATHIFVHAGLTPERTLDQQDDETLYWEKWESPRPHCSGKIMVCGHTAQKNGWPRSVEHAICIDTWVYGSGWLTCLEPATGRFWQARKSGETRSGGLDDQTMM